MIPEETLAELHQRFPSLSEEAYNHDRLVPADVDRLIESSGLDWRMLLSQIALHLALGFSDRTLSFAHCDAIINGLWAYIVAGPLTQTSDGKVFEFPKYFIDVFIAFEEGEYHHRGNRDEDPSEVYTRPLIKELLDTFRAHSVD